MAVGEGKFVLYSRITPPLQAGDYRLNASQTLAASRGAEILGASQLPVASLPTHFRVRAPRYQLPPDQVLSTFPPANSEGSYGSRLPQIVIKRRTLPWERHVGPGGVEQTPWLALVVIAEGEAELKLNAPIDQCVTPGVTLAGVPDAEQGNYLLVRKSVIDRVFPTRLDVPLLAHAREVDIHDTELMMGDDDGFLAVVIANRLPLPAKDADGNEAPKKYLACLINLEQQFQTLLERAPEPELFTLAPELMATSMHTLAEWDHASMSMPAAAATAAPITAAGVRGAPVRGRAVATPAVKGAGINPAASAATTFEASSSWSAGSKPARDVYSEMAQPFAHANLELAPLLLDPTHRFPVLLHWSFTSVGLTTFRKLMEDLDIGLLGTAPEKTPDGREPLESVETGHVGLCHRTRRGDPVRAWYRGPCVPHPTQDPPGGRLPLAHASDQLRIVVPDGREDLSLAAAFEIGRLLALSRPQMINALLRWRQLDYQAARRQAIWRAGEPLFELLNIELERIGPELGVRLGRGLVQSIAARPAEFLGNTQPLVAAGRPLELEKSALEQLALGLAISEQVLQAPPAELLATLSKTEVPHAPLPALELKGGVLADALSQQALTGALDGKLTQLVMGTLPELAIPARRKRGAKLPAHQPDALDRLLDELEATAEDER